MTDQNSVTISGEPPDPNGQGGINIIAPDPNVGNTNTGFLIGTQEPAYVQQQRYAHAPVAPEPRTLTPEEVAAVSQQTVNPQLQTMEQRMAAMQIEIDAAKAEREAAATATAEAEAARVAAEQAAAEEKLSATELVNKVREEFQQKFDQQQAQVAASNAILEQERHFQVLQEYKANRLADPEIAKAVMPHLHQYIVGNSEQEIEEAIARAAATSNNITAEFQQYQQQFRQQAPGVSTAAPTAGPMESQTQLRTMSAQEIAALPHAEYARLRPQLLRAASDAHRAQQGG